MPSARSTTRSAGRPRDPELDQRIQDAAIAVYYDEGWAGYNFDAVANRAGVGKSSIYLRWSSKEGLLVDALRARTAHITTVDTGTLRGDLIEMACQQIKNYTAPYGLVTLRLIVESPKHPALASRSRQRLDAHLSERDMIMERAVRRRELANDSPRELILDSISGAVLNMVISRSESARQELRENANAYATSIVDFVLRHA